MTELTIHPGLFPGPSSYHDPGRWGYDGGSAWTFVRPDRPVPPGDLTQTAGGGLELETTASLLEYARQGDTRACDVLFARCLPALRRWARGRVPAGARHLLQTDDLVQDAAHGVLRHLDTFQSRHPGALLAYLREAVLNRIRTEVRRMATRPTAVDLDEDVTDGGPSPLELAMGRDDLAHYEAALARLRPLYQEAIIARIEMQSSYEEIAQALGKPNANAARSLVVRALYKLYEEMRHGR
jgi:RNA polymerase sigma factor (sigma-70 family)